MYSYDGDYEYISENEEYTDYESEYEEYEEYDDIFFMDENFRYSRNDI